MSEFETYTSDAWLKKHHVWGFLFLVFVGILSFMLYTSQSLLFDMSFLSGDVIKNSTTESIQFQSKLTIPTQKMNGDVEKIEIIGDPGTVLQVGDQKFDFTGSKNIKMSLYEFEGNIELNQNTLEILKGKVTSATIDGVLIEPSSGKTIKVSISDPLRFRSLSIINISKTDISYITSGSITLQGNKAQINLKDEELKINNFIGNIKISGATFQLNGKSDKIEIQGNQTIIVR